MIDSIVVLDGIVALTTLKLPNPSIVGIGGVVFREGECDIARRDAVEIRVVYYRGGCSGVGGKGLVRVLVADEWRVSGWSRNVGCGKCCQPRRE